MPIKKAKWVAPSVENNYLLTYTVGDFEQGGYSNGYQGKRPGMSREGACLPIV